MTCTATRLAAKASDHAPCTPRIAVAKRLRTSRLRIAGGVVTLTTTGTRPIGRTNSNSKLGFSVNDCTGASATVVNALVGSAVKSAAASNSRAGPMFTFPSCVPASAVAAAPARGLAVNGSKRRAALNRAMTWSTVN
jgi:hypothetical protein